MLVLVCDRTSGQSTKDQVGQQSQDDSDNEGFARTDRVVRSCDDELIDHVENYRQDEDFSY